MHTYLAGVSSKSCRTDANEFQPLVYTGASILAWTGLAAFTCGNKLKIPYILCECFREPFKFDDPVS